MTVGTGTSSSIGSSLLNIVSGTVSGASLSYYRLVDYGPLSARWYASITQRIANQTSGLCLVDSPSSPGAEACVLFTGTTNTTATFQTCSASGVCETPTVTLPNAGTTATSHRYQVDIGADQAALTIDGTTVQINQLHIPGPYQALYLDEYVSNAATVTTTTLAVDVAHTTNYDQIQVTGDSRGDQGINMAGTGPASPGTSSSQSQLSGVVYNSVAPTLTSGQQAATQADANGNTLVNLKTALPAGSNIVGKCTTDQTTHGTTDLVAGDITKVAGAAVATGHGTAAGSVRVELPTDGTGVVGLAAGSNVIGKCTVDQTTSGTTNAVVPIPITGAAPALSNGPLATLTASVNVKASAGNVYGIAYANGAATVCWVECVNSASAGTLGTASLLSIPMGGSATGTWTSEMPVQFSSGIACGIATAPGGASACGTAGNITVFYK